MGSIRGVQRERGGAFMQAGCPVRAEGAARLGSSCTDTRTSSDNGSLSGSAYVYRFDGATWTQEQKLLAADREAGDRFGTSVAVVEDIILVGAYSDDEDVDDGGINFGSAYVFEFSGGLWTENDKLTASDGDNNDRFGHSVDVNGDVAVVGAYLGENDGSLQGSAYAFEL